MRIGSSEKLTGHILALVAVLVWGSCFVVSKFILVHFTAMQYMMVRMFAAYIALFIIYPKWHFKIKDEIYFFGLSFFSNTLYYSLENIALEHTQATNVSILVSTSPIMAVVLLYLTKRNTDITRREWAGIFISFIGVILVIFNGVFYLKLDPIGDGLSLLSALSWALYSLIVVDAMKKFDSRLITRKLMLYSFICSIPMVVIEGKPFDFEYLISAECIFSFLYVGCLACGVCYVLYALSIKKIGIITANFYNYICPVVTLIVGLIVLNEKVSIMGIIGIAIVIFGLILSSIDQKE